MDKWGSQKGEYTINKVCMQHKVLARESNCGKAACHEIPHTHICHGLGLACLELLDSGTKNRLLAVVEQNVRAAVRIHQRGRIRVLHDEPHETHFLCVRNFSPLSSPSPKTTISPKK